jgi:hypothetical protein
MAKRSPNYPSLTLEQSAERVRRVYDSEHTHSAPREVIATALGYNSLNGASLSVIGALSQYGLLEKVETGSLKVSSDAVSVLELEKGDQQRAEALERLAFPPKLFAELRGRFGSELPSDTNLKHFLIQEKEFLPKAATDVIRVYRANLELVTNESGDYDGGNQEKGEHPPMNPQEKHKSSEQIVAHRELDGGLRLQTTSSRHEFSFPLSFQRDIKATVTISGSGKLLRKDLEFLKKKVADLLEGFDDEEEMIIRPEEKEADMPEGETK